MPVEGPAWRQFEPSLSVRGDAGGLVEVTTLLLGRGRRRLHACRRCVVCACISWFLLSQLVVDSVQGKLFFKECFMFT